MKLRKRKLHGIWKKISSAPNFRTNGGKRHKQHLKKLPIYLIYALVNVFPLMVFFSFFSSVV